ncbi:MAG: iron chelate uptake ABC transporter family permease subunit [Akkermansiaceae bacterium]|jgi:manganese/zinc/iron transport system permease protein|nr:iron chelate uptake ABC transporter family permease subunit [Akkermansiaceae bacterium]
MTWELLRETLLLEQHNTRLPVLGVAFLGATAGLVGSFLLLRKQSLLGDALSHATLPGIGIAFAVMSIMGFSGKNLPGLLVGATITGLLGVLLVLAIRKTTRLKDDAAMGIVLSVFFGLGVAILKMVERIPGQSAAGLDGFIYGKTASMVWSDFILITVILVVTTAVTIAILKELTLLCFDASFASVQGWPTLWLDIILMALVTSVTVVGLQAVGLILIIAFLITPPTAARFWTNRLGWMLLLSATIGAISGWLGVSISALYSNLPAGAIIVISAAIIFLFSMIFGTARGVLPRYLRHLQLKRKVGRQHLLRSTYEILENSQKNKPLKNLPISMELLRKHRFWSKGELLTLIRQARSEDHIERQPSGELRLSESGFGEASRITRNHRLWELYLIKYADIAPSHVDRDADMVEHLLGAEIVHQLEAELDLSKPTIDSPHTIEPTELGLQSEPTT